MLEGVGLHGGTVRRQELTLGIGNDRAAADTDRDHDVVLELVADRAVGDTDGLPVIDLDNEEMLFRTATPFWCWFAG